MVFLANFFVAAVLVALGYMFKAIEWNFGQAAVFWMAVGWIGATVMWQCVHKSRYGHWFDPPDANGDGA